jgi:hypothetical protein
MANLRHDPKADRLTAMESARFRLHNRGMPGIIPDGPSGHLTNQFLEWIAEAPRTYGEVMDARRTSCPRLSIWEDAVIDGLVRLGEGSGRQRRVILTDRGRTLLEGSTVAAE